MKSNHKDPDLQVDDIKDILEQLQNLNISENSVITEDNKISLDETKNMSSSKPPSKSNSLFISLSILALCISGAAGYSVYYFSQQPAVKPVKVEQKVEEKEAVQQIVKQPPPKEPSENLEPRENKNPPENKVITRSKKLISEGKILSARKLLLGEIRNNTNIAEIPFLLAQTYDPNFLKDLPSFDADAELNEARKWYQTWYDIAQNSANPPSLQRLRDILNSLR